MATAPIPPKMQEKYKKLEEIARQLRNMTATLRVVQDNLEQLENTLTRLEETPDDARIFESIGSFLVETEKSKAVARLREQIERYRAYIKGLKKRIKEAEKEYNTLAQELAGSLAVPPATAG